MFYLLLRTINKQINSDVKQSQNTQGYGHFAMQRLKFEWIYVQTFNKRTLQVSKKRES